MRGTLKTVGAYLAIGAMIVAGLVLVAVLFGSWIGLTGFVAFWVIGFALVKAERY